MRYSQLRAFHHVALEGGFSRAARALNQTQPSLSDQVRSLENAHDVLLFHRQGRQVRLTEAGEGLLRLTRAFFELEDRIGDYLDQSRAALAGKLRIVADSALHVMPTVGRFRVAHPDVFVSLRTGNTSEVLQALRDYQAEVGVVGFLPEAPDLDAVDLGRSPVVAIAARGLLPRGVASVALDELARWPLVLREDGSRTRALLEEAVRRAGGTLRPVIEVDGREAMRDVVASGAGLGFVSAAEMGRDDRLVQVPIRGCDLTMTETLVTLRSRRDVPVIRAFLRALGQ